jgi:hypothetical protein
VVGTGDPDIDVPAVQAAVDHGGHVLLRGHFSFDRPPTIPSIPGFPQAMVGVSKGVAIAGARDEDEEMTREDGEMTSIEAGTMPFFVHAPGARVTIQGLRFIRPKIFGIQVAAVDGLVIADCRIEGMDPGPTVFSASYAQGIGVADAGPPNPVLVSGTLRIVNNDIDVGGTADDTTLGMLIAVLGQAPQQGVDLYILGNHLSNITERVINVNSVIGRVHIEQNVITTGPFFHPVPTGVPPNAIHAVVVGSTVIAHNAIRSAWATGSGILVHGGGFLRLAEADAIVMDNEVTMVAPEGTVFGANSAGIWILGDAQHNVVLQNRIRGRGRAALAVSDDGAKIPGNNTFVLNDLTGFQSSLADVVIDAGVTNTLIVGRQRSVVDHGVGTVIVPVPSS